MRLLFRSKEASIMRKPVRPLCRTRYGRVGHARETFDCSIEITVNEIASLASVNRVGEGRKSRLTQDAVVQRAIAQFDEMRRPWIGV